MINKIWRYYRLSPNMIFLHYSDFSEKTFIRDGISSSKDTAEYIHILTEIGVLKLNY
jgi:hypothetical protein